MTELLRLRCRAGSADAGTRLDVYLPDAVRRKHGLELSRRAVRRALQAGAVYVNGKRVRVASRSVRENDRVEIVLKTDPMGESRVETANPPPALRADQILYEDEDLLVIDKIAGLPSQATQTDALGHALEQARAYLRQRAGRSKPVRDPYVALPHRLDRGTSGALAVATSRRAASALSKAFELSRIEKRYLLIVGAPEEFPAEPTWTVRQPLAPEGRRMVPDFLGKEAITEIEMMAKSETPEGRFALLWASPKTGRKHQIRAHAASEGFPILGDRLYSPAPFDRAAPRPMLHAAALELEHPIDHRPLRIECPMPEDFRAVLDQCGLKVETHSPESISDP